MEWLKTPIVVAIKLPLLIFMIAIGILWIWFRKEVKIFLRSFIIFICITVILCYLLYMASKYITGAEKFLTDSSGRFNLGVISMLVAGVSFLAGIEEREKLKKRELEREKKERIFKAVYEYINEWDVIADSYQNVKHYIISEADAMKKENEEITDLERGVIKKMIEDAKKRENETGKYDVSPEQAQDYEDTLVNGISEIKKKTNSRLKLRSGFSDRMDAIQYYSTIDTYRLNQTYYQLRLLVDEEEEENSKGTSGGDNSIIKESKEYIDKTKTELGIELDKYYNVVGTGEDKHKEFCEWHDNNNDAKDAIKEKLDEYAKKIAKETLK